MRKFPAIICDIDGVLIRGSQQIGKSSQVLKYIRQPISNIIPNIAQIPPQQQIPFICLTNGGGKLEQDKADQLNQLLNLSQKDQNKFQGKDILLNFSPLRPIMNQFSTKPVLIIGSQDIERIAVSAGLLNYVTIDEYCSMYPNLVSVNKRDRFDQIATKNKVQQRLSKSQRGVRLNNSEKYLQIHGIFILNDVVYWEDSIQIICDLCSSSDGKISRLVSPTLEQHIPIFTVNNDILYADEFPLPRFAGGTFTQALKYIFYNVYNRLPYIIEYGKPTQNTYNYAEQYVRDQYNQTQISNFYMIGDNPKSDIRGGNQKGWTTILVRSGIFNGENDESDPATHVVDDFYEAIKLICQKEDIPFNI